MARYIPPSLRKDKTEEEVIQEVQTLSLNDFPVLDGLKLVDNTPKLEQALNWEEKRIQAQIKQRTDARMSELKKLRQAQEAEENRLIFSYAAKAKPVVPIVPKKVEESEPEVKDPDEWIEVRPKPRKMRAQKVFEEEENVLPELYVEED